MIRNCIIAGNRARRPRRQPTIVTARLRKHEEGIDANYATATNSSCISTIQRRRQIKSNRATVATAMFKAAAGRRQHDADPLFVASDSGPVRLTAGDYHLRSQVGVGRRREHLDVRRDQPCVDTAILRRMAASPEGSEGTQSSTPHRHGAMADPSQSRPGNP